MPRGISEETVEDYARKRAMKHGFSLPERVFTEGAEDGQRYSSYGGRVYIEFPHEEAAQQFMRITSGKMSLNGVTISMEFKSVSSSGQPAKRGGDDSMESDWMCAQCRFVNYSRRPACHSCGATVNASCVPIPSAGEISRQLTLRNQEMDFLADQLPSCTLMVRGISRSFTQYDVTSFFANSVQIKQVRLFLDRGFGFIEFNSIQDAATALHIAKANGNKIGDHTVRLHFAQNNNRLRPDEQWAQQMDAQAYQLTQEEQRRAQEEETKKPPTVPKGLNESMWADYISRFTEAEEKKQRAQEDTSQTRQRKLKEMAQRGRERVTKSPERTQSTMQLDKASGYYRCSETQLYYDPGSTYFFTSLTTKGRYYIYCGDRRALVQVNSDGQMMAGRETVPWPPRKGQGPPDNLDECSDGMDISPKSEDLTQIGEGFHEVRHKAQREVGSAPSSTRGLAPDVDFSSSFLSLAMRDERAARENPPRPGPYSLPDGLAPPAASPDWSSQAMPNRSNYQDFRCM